MDSLGSRSTQEDFNEYRTLVQKLDMFGALEVFVRSLDLYSTDPRLSKIVKLYDATKKVWKPLELKFLSYPDPKG